MNRRAVFNAIWESAAVVLRRASPGDFASSTPIYVVDAADVNGQVSELAYPAARSTCLAFAGASTAQHIRRYLESEGRWKGPGFACVVYADRLAKELPNAPSARLAAGIGVVVHEAAHWLEHVIHPRQRSLDVKRQFVSDVASDTVLRSYHLTKGPPSAAAHGAPFIRAGLHLWHRVNALYPMPASRCFIADAKYGLSPPEHYAATLASELQSSRDLPITHILTTRPPEQFVRFWGRDCTRSPRR